MHEAHGGPAALQAFVDAAHGAGVGVCLDVVYNHLGPSGNYLSQFAPYFTDRHSTPWGDAINLDGPGSPHVRRWICDNALRWFTDFHVDALRLDAVHALQDGSPVHVLAQLRPDAGDATVRALVHASVGAIQSVLFYSSGLADDQLAALMSSVAEASSLVSAATFT